MAEILGRGLAKGGTPKKPTAPGQLASHYAPRGQVRLNAVQAMPGEIHVGFGDIVGDVTLSATGDLAEAAARLFPLLHELDANTPAAFGSSLFSAAPPRVPVAAFQFVFPSKKGPSR